jgi:hypothetical protein
MSLSSVWVTVTAKTTGVGLMKILGIGDSTNRRWEASSPGRHYLKADLGQCAKAQHIATRDIGSLVLAIKATLNSSAEFRHHRSTSAVHWHIGV